MTLLCSQHVRWCKPHRDERSCKLFAWQALKLWLDDVVESCSDTVGLLFEAELARACSPDEAGSSSLSGLEDDWHLRSGQGEYMGSTQRRSGAARQSGRRVGSRGGGPALRAPAPSLFAGRGDALDGLEGVSELDWQAAAPRQEDKSGRSVWTLDELAEEWYDTSRTVRDRELSDAEACLAGAACR